MTENVGGIRLGNTSGGFVIIEELLIHSYRFIIGT